MSELVSFPIQLDAEDKWHLGADSLQWILYRKRISKGNANMFGQSFIAGSRNIFDRIFKEHGIVVTDEANALIDTLPEMFLDFHEIYKTKSGKGRKKGYKPNK